MIITRTKEDVIRERKENLLSTRNKEGQTYSYVFKLYLSWYHELTHALEKRTDRTIADNYMLTTCFNQFVENEVKLEQFLIYSRKDNTEIFSPKMNKSNVIRNYTYYGFIDQPASKMLLKFLRLRNVLAHSVTPDSMNTLSSIPIDYGKSPKGYLDSREIEQQNAEISMSFAVNVLFSYRGWLEDIFFNTSDQTRRTNNSLGITREELVC